MCNRLSYYHFFDQPLTFGLMALTTALAFILAVRLDAQAVAVLGLLGGFLTPLLLSTGVDNPAGLFGYIALLDIGLVAVVLRKRWNYLLLLAAVATVAMQYGWVGKFFVEEKVYIAMSIFVGFSALFVLTLVIAHRLKQVDQWISAAAILMLSAALIFPLYLMVHPYPALAQNTVLMLGFVFVIDLGLLAITYLRDELRLIHAWAGGSVFFILATWTTGWLAPERLNEALCFYLLYSILHTAFPVVLHRVRPAATTLWLVHLYPVFALLLIFFPLVQYPNVALLLWPVVLFINIISLVIGVITASLLSIMAVFILTMIAVAIWISHASFAPSGVPEIGGFLLIIGGFGIFSLISLIWASRKMLAPGRAGLGTMSTTGPTSTLSEEQFTQLVSVTALLPFILLVLVVQHIPLSDPSTVFGLAALMLVIMLSIVKIYATDLRIPVALFAVFLMECVWHCKSFSTEHVGIAVSWNLGFSGLFIIFPFLFLKEMKNRVCLWSSAALALPVHFLLIYNAVDSAFPKYQYMGLLPAILAIPEFLGLGILIKQIPKESTGRNTLFALFGGATLFFITLIFPIQFERQWITVSWALEGLALLWLFHRVPHPGLRTVGFILLVVGFIRLAVNIEYITEYGRSGTPIFNEYLYTYGIVTVCLLLGGKLLAPPRNVILGSSVQPVVYTLGTVLAFILLNIEIADYFCPPETRLKFNFGVDFAQDMTYSLGWSAFAVILLTAGFKLRKSVVRFAGMGLMIVTIFKLFLHDLWQLGGLYRIGSLIGLAVVLMGISFIYQQFLSKAALDDDLQKQV